MNPLDFRALDKWLIGSAWIDSQIANHLDTFCDAIGVRWAGSPGERAAAEYAQSQLAQLELDAQIEEYQLQTASVGDSTLRIVGEDRELDHRPCLFCPSLEIEGPVVDVGFGMPHELAALPRESSLAGAVALIREDFEPFSEPRTLALRLADLAAAGAACAVTPSPHRGRRLRHMSAGDWRDGQPTRVPLPLVQTSAEDFSRLQRQVASGVRLAVRVETEFGEATSWNARADLPGAQPEESLVLAAHHDTTPDSPGANDNAAGVAVMLETARLLTQLQQSSGVRPGRTIRFVSFGGEEQGLQGSEAFVTQHYGPETPPRLMINLDEIATGPIKGVVLQFPELRAFVQQQLDSMHEGLQCHVLAQLDASGDMYPFARRGIPSSILWRWRFVGRHPDTAYGHSSSDTREKVRLRELKEYAGHLSRLLLRLSHAENWPANLLDPRQIAARLESERGTVFRTM